MKEKFLKGPFKALGILALAVVMMIYGYGNGEAKVVLEKAIKELPGVENAFIRAFSNGKGVIEVEGSLKPVQIFKALREKMSIFMENTADNTLEISI